MDPQPVAFFSFSFPFFVCLVACLETSFLFFLFFLASVSSGHGFRPSAAHHVNNRVMLQCVFHTELVWIRGLDWHAGLSIHTGYGIPAGRTGLARRTECCAASVRKPQTWGRRGQNFLFRTSPASLPRPTSPRIIDIAQIKITVVAHLDVGTHI